MMIKIKQHFELLLCYHRKKACHKVDTSKCLAFTLYSQNYPDNWWHNSSRQTIFTQIAKCQLWNAHGPDNITSREMKMVHAGFSHGIANISRMSFRETIPANSHALGVSLTPAGWKRRSHAGSRLRANFSRLMEKCELLPSCLRQFPKIC